MNSILIGSITVVAGITMLSIPVPSQASSLERWCRVAKEVNDSYRESVAPGTLVARESGLSNYEYGQLWSAAKTSNIPVCNSLW